MATILVIDDEPDIREVIRFALEGAGFRVLEAGHADAARKLLLSENPDLLLLDWGLPGRTAADLLPTLRQVCPDLYVIALGSHPGAGHAALAAGADAFFSKTDPPDRLLVAIHEHARRAIP